MMRRCYDSPTITKSSSISSSSSSQKNIAFLSNHCTCCNNTYFVICMIVVLLFPFFCLVPLTTTFVDSFIVVSSQQQQQRNIIIQQQQQKQLQQKSIDIVNFPITLSKKSSCTTTTTATCASTRLYLVHAKQQQHYQPRKRQQTPLFLGSIVTTFVNTFLDRSTSGSSTRTTKGSSVRSSLSNNNNNNNMENNHHHHKKKNHDAAAFHTYAASSVDLSDCHVGVNGIFTVVRSVRDIDNNKKRKYLYTIPIINQNQQIQQQQQEQQQEQLLTSSSKDPKFLEDSCMMLPPQLMNDSILLRLPSPSGRMVLIVRNDESTSSSNNGNRNGPKKTIFEIWTRNGCSLQYRWSVQNTSKEKRQHGNIILNPGGFGIPSWNIQETAIVYTAERNVIKTTSSFFDGTFHDIIADHDMDNDDDGGGSGGGVGEQYTMDVGVQETWGEKYSHQSSPIHDIYILHIVTGRMEQVQNVPGHDDDDDKKYNNMNTIHNTKKNANQNNQNHKSQYTFGQVCFHPDGTSIVYTGWEVAGGGGGGGSSSSSSPTTSMPRRLGLIYCQQRSSKIYESSIQQLFQRISTTTTNDGSSSSSSTKNNQQDDDINDDTTVTTNDTEYRVLTPEYRFAVSPRFTTTQFIFLSTSSTNKNGFDTHSGCYALHSMNYVSDSSSSSSDHTIQMETHRIVVDQVWNPATHIETAMDEKSGEVTTVNKMRFPGLYLQELPYRLCCIPGTDDVLVTTQWGCSSKIIKISCANNHKNRSTSQKKSIISLIQCPTTTNGGKKILNQSIEYSNELLCITPSGDAIVAVKACNQPATHVYCIPRKNLYSGSDEIEDWVPKIISTFYPISCTKYSVPPETFQPNFDVQLITINPPMIEGVDFNEPIQSILLVPKGKEGQQSTNTDDTTIQKIPHNLIVVLHGGPHSISSNTYLPSYAYLCGHGQFAVLLVNYRGSSGYGQGSIESLRGGKISIVDVQDVIASVQHVLEHYYDPLSIVKLGICGGSHGGFLTAHLTVQYPTLFQAAVLRNPVINLPSMVTATDIPDWVYVECCCNPQQQQPRNDNNNVITDNDKTTNTFITIDSDNSGGGGGSSNSYSYDFTQYQPPTFEQIRCMYEVSPIRYGVSNVITPTLMAIGMKDLRVPPSQGLEWYYSLKSKNNQQHQHHDKHKNNNNDQPQVVPIKLLLYENDDHALDTVITEADHWINIKRWFDEHLLL